MATKWGIASAGLISHDFVTAMGTLPKDEHKIVAVAARDLKRAKEFAELHKIPNAYSSYEELATNPDIEVVYIGVINTYHFDVAKMMLEHGKHVLCEKPLCMNYEESKKLVQLAEEKKLFLMEAVWSRCFPSYEYVRREIAAGIIGEVVQINADFGIFLEADRVKRKEFGGGTILDLGVYVLQLAVMVFDKVMPETIKAVGHVNADGVDDSTAIVMTYPGSKTAVLSTSSLAKLKNEAFIYGTKGSIKIADPFWCPTVVTCGDKRNEFELPPAAHPFNFWNCAGLRYEAIEVRRCLKEGLLESSKMTHAESLLIAQLQDSVRAQLGVDFLNPLEK